MSVVRCAGGEGRAVVKDEFARAFGAFAAAVGFLEGVQVSPQFQDGFL